jgi:signal transduction histidine kinase/CheY-like chemotaxis protein
VNLNLAAARLLDPLAQPGQIYYGMVQPPSRSGSGPVAGTLPRRGPGLPLKEAFPWLESHLDDGFLEEGVELNLEVGGTTRHFGLKVSNMLDVSGKFSATVLLLHDVGLLKEAQELRRSVEVRMLELRRQEGLASMAGGIAHDFNNMLATIVGNVALIREQLPWDAPVTEQVVQIQRTAVSASELASQMLAYSGKGHFRLGALDLNDEVEKTARLIQSTVTARYPVDLRLEHDLPLAQAEGRQIRQLLMELCLNAQEAYRGAEGRILVRTFLADLRQADLDGMRIGTERHPGTYLALEVGDQGEGMTPEVLARAFDPFFTTRMVGRGLGLAAVYGIVRGHGGALQVQSSPGGGSSVTVYLQVAPAPEPADPVVAQSQGPAQDARSHRMLLVDDEASVAYVFSRLLALKGFSVVVAKDGEDALAKAQTQGPFDLVLTDWTMPGLSGKALLEALGSQLPGVPLVVMSGFAEDALDSLGGEVPFIHKPFSLGDLLSFLERLGFYRKG